MTDSNLCPTCHKPTNESSPYREMTVSNAPIEVKRQWLSRLIKHDILVRKGVKKAFSIVVKMSTMLGVIASGSAIATYAPYYYGKLIGVSVLGLSAPTSKDIAIVWMLGLMSLALTIVMACGLLYIIRLLYRTTSNILDNRFPSLRQ